MDMGSFLSTILRIILNYNSDPYVHYSGSLNKAHIDSSSCRDKWGSMGMKQI